MRSLLFLAALLASPAALPDWQATKPVRIVVPFAPGGQPDIVARALAEPLGTCLGQPVVVENRPGAGGNIAAEAVAKSPPDGHTLLMGTNGPLAVSPALYRNLPYDPLRDLAPVTLVGTSPNLIAVHPSLGVSTLAELVAKAKAEPGKLNFSSVGKGSVSQLSMELLNSVAGIRTVHIPYNGGAPAVTALIAGDVQVLSLNPTALIPQMDAGQGEGDRADLAAALAARPWSPHRGRIRLSGIRSRRVDGGDGAREDAARCGEAPQRRAGEDHPRPGAARNALEPTVDRSGRQHARGSHRGDPPRERQVGAHGEVRRHRGGMSVPMDAFAVRLDERLHETPVDAAAFALALDALVEEIAQARSQPARLLAMLAKAAPLLRAGGRLEEARRTASAAIALAELLEDAGAVYVNQLELARVMQWERRFEIATPLYERLVSQARSAPAYAASLHDVLHHAGPISSTSGACLKRHAISANRRRCAAPKGWSRCSRSRRGAAPLRR
jgi:hypothetical protein